MTKVMQAVSISPGKMQTREPDVCSTILMWMLIEGVLSQAHEHRDKVAISASDMNLGQCRRTCRTKMDTASLWIN